MVGPGKRSYIVRDAEILWALACLAVLAGLAFLPLKFGIEFWSLPMFVAGGIGWLYFEYEFRRLDGKIPFELGFTARVEREGRLPWTLRHIACVAPLLVLAKDAYPPVAYLLWPSAVFAAAFAIYLLLVCDLPGRTEWMAASVVAANLAAVALLYV
ncbi:MAG: hypothetical protein ACO1SV_00955 [Fimbriimonas sp.]